MELYNLAEGRQVHYFDLLNVSLGGCCTTATQSSQTGFRQLSAESWSTFFYFPLCSRFTGARIGRIPWRRAWDFPRQPSLTRGHSRFPSDNSLLFTSKTAMPDHS